MASDETMMSTIQDEDFEDDDHTHHYHHNLSRLSVCTSSTICGVDEDVDNLASICMSNLSIESFEGDGADGDDADGEFSADGKEDDQLLQTGLSSGSENESGSCYSLPATPPRRRSLIPATTIGVKDYASENEVRKEINSNDLGKSSSSSRSRRRRRRSLRSVFERGNSWENLWDKKKMKENGMNSGESDHGVMVITRPKGGNRSLCMDLDEVKACRDLGFELEHERISAVSFSNSTFDTSSGGNSPIANWRISGPGDDPRDVKARLKVWAQAVAIASATKYGS
ncbi:hypothetical protein L195_g015651 [Trifolium pratense]|uniref:Fold protein n=1 Tax=Trifolium pratense TaxID=57577 RepID=A0A2K3MNY3_TRIPR|nr:hypothetical protein L195_g015651 [Trifolium pratense]